MMSTPSSSTSSSSTSSTPTKDEKPNNTENSNDSETSSKSNVNNYDGVQSINSSFKIISQENNNTLNNIRNVKPKPTNSTKENSPNSHIRNSSTFSHNKNEEFQFIKPPECPVFTPTEEEFKNPLAYIGKIRRFAEIYGIAKIKPPKTWNPPFTVDVDKFKFTPRVQRLNELEAKTRVKLNFLDQIAKFWDLQGSSLKIPMVERKALDLYSLYRTVQEEGGNEQITKEFKWSKIAHRMGYPSSKIIGGILKGHYERILYPFDTFTSGKLIDKKLNTQIDEQVNDIAKDIIESQEQQPNKTSVRRSKRVSNVKNESYDLGQSSSSSFKALSSSFETKTTQVSQIFDSSANILSSSSNGKKNDESPKSVKDNTINHGEYKRMHSFDEKVASKESTQNRRSMSDINDSSKNLNRNKIDPLSKYICHICNRGDSENNMLLCDGCDDSYHTFCLIPSLNNIPKEGWFCPKCVVEEVSKQTAEFGFEQAQKEYTLQQFGEMADQFKADYFNRAVHLVPNDLVEREFWRIVSSIDEDVTVEYGADLHAMDHGSGFPTKSSFHLLPGDREYAESNWNLNNLPVLEESILRHINANISGMKIPWMYVGMCFATFCWHNEDHWSYSINYLHWGEPKTWYGVPGNKAEAFEETMKSTAPELFQSQPDLLHQLVTIMNPNILMKNNVPVYRTDQHAGEFIVTFPRAYHAGFNQGYNFAEAVNFAPADWIKLGRECINHYSMLRRFCVFSHDELICNMALNPDKLNVGIATACYLDMAEMLDSEKKLRKSVLEWGVTKAEQQTFELIPDDERLCDLCKTTCFLSALTCSCTKSIVCLRHYKELCNCSPDNHTLHYRYTLNELPEMFKKLRVRALKFDNWLLKICDILDDSKIQTKITFEELKYLNIQAKEKKFPSSIILERLNSAVIAAEKCITVIQMLDINNKIHTRTRNTTESDKYKLTMEEIHLFLEEINSLYCTIKEGKCIKELQILGNEFVKNSKVILSKKLNQIYESELNELILYGSSLSIDLHEIERLKCRLEQLKWYRRIRNYFNANEKMSVDDIKILIKDGLNTVPDVFVEQELSNLQKIYAEVESWEEDAQAYLTKGNQYDMPAIESLLEQAKHIKGELASESALRNAVKKTKDWLNNIDVIQSQQIYPYFHTLENIVNNGKKIPFKLIYLVGLEEHLENAKNWKNKITKIFLKRQTQFNIMDILLPRTESFMIQSTKKNKPIAQQFLENMSPQEVFEQFKIAEEKELNDIRALRQTNIMKNPSVDKYCICKRKFQGNMYNCQLCKDWFHEHCVPPPKNTVRKHPSMSTPVLNNFVFVPPLNCREKDKESKYLCPSCMRSRRPRLETFLSLLTSLQTLPVRFPEGEALQYLTERAINWQNLVKKAFASEDIASAIATLSIISHNIEKNTKQKDNNISNSGSMEIKSKDNKETKRKSQINSEDKCLDQHNLKEENLNKSRLDDKNLNKSSTRNENLDESTSSEEDFHQFQTNNSGNSGLTRPLFKSDLPLITLSQSTREQLEDLMMEGDILEVSLNETLYLWRILNASKPSISDLACIYHRLNTGQATNDILVTSYNNNKSTSNKRASTDDSNIVPVKKINIENNGTPDSVKAKSSRKSKKKSVGETNNDLQLSLNMSGNSSIKIEPSEVLPTNITEGTNATITLTGKKRKRRRKRVLNKKALTQAEIETITISSSDEDGECSASNCANPSGREVNWVQCDGGCNKWYHMLCVGIDINDIKPDDDYICKQCKSQNNN